MATGSLPAGQSAQEAQAAWRFKRTKTKSGTFDSPVALAACGEWLLRWTGRFPPSHRGPRPQGDVTEPPFRNLVYASCSGSQPWARCPPGDIGQNCRHLWLSQLVTVTGGL